MVVLTPGQLASVRFDERGLVPAIVQDHRRGDVLMLAWMDAAALARTLELGQAVFYSRSRGEQWHKGATSGNIQRLVDLRLDCDGDTLLLLVAPEGDEVACHTGERSCFHRLLPDGPTGVAPAAPPLASCAAASTESTESPESPVSTESTETPVSPVSPDRSARP
jgi:phosphoribosyl-AMP cyclohydrolase